MTDQHYYRNLARSMMFAVILVSFIPLLSVSIMAGYQYSVVYKEKVTANLHELVLKHDQGITDFLKANIAELRVLAAMEGVASLKDESKLRLLHDSLIKFHKGVFVDIGLVDESGTQVAYAGPYKLRGANYADASWFNEVKQRQVYISDVFLGLRNSPHFIIALLLEDSSGEWVLRATLDSEAFNNIVEDMRVGETGLAYIINRQGNFQTAPRVDLTAEVPLLRKLTSPQNGTPRLMQGKVTTTTAKSPTTGRDTLYITSPINEGNWLLVYQQDENDAFTDIVRSRNLAMLILTLGGISIAIMAYFLSQRMARKVEQADQGKEIMNDQVIEAGKLASVGELAAGIAHEINNPVAIMVEEAGWIQDLLEEGLDVDDNNREAQRALAQIRSQGTRCKEITHKLLSFARKIDPTITAVCLNDQVEEMAALSEQRAKYANVQIETSLENELPMVAASPSELQQVLLNLVNNAIDAMDGDGGNLDLATRHEDDTVIVTVADTGCGIPEANLSRIFDPFFTTKPVGKGTGLGLSIIYGIVNKMGGEISVKSVIDRGTTFTIRLPVIEHPNNPPAEGSISDQTT